MKTPQVPSYLALQIRHIMKVVRTWFYLKNMHPVYSGARWSGNIDAITNSHVESGRRFSQKAHLADFPTEWGKRCWDILYRRWSQGDSTEDMRLPYILWHVQSGPISTIYEDLFTGTSEVANFQSASDCD